MPSAPSNDDGIIIIIMTPPMSLHQRLERNNERHPELAVATIASALCAWPVILLPHFQGRVVRVCRRQIYAGKQKCWRPNKDCRRGKGQKRCGYFFHNDLLFVSNDVDAHRTVKVS